MAIDLFKPKAPPLFGLDISSSSVKMLEIVEAGKGAYRVERYSIEPLPRDAVVDGNINNLEAVAESVKRAHKRLGTRTRTSPWRSPTGAVITKKIQVAAQPDRGRSSRCRSRARPTSTSRSRSRK